MPEPTNTNDTSNSQQEGVIGPGGPQSQGSLFLNDSSATPQSTPQGDGQQGAPATPNGSSQGPPPDDSAVMAEQPPPEFDLDPMAAMDDVWADVEAQQSQQQPAGSENTSASDSPQGDNPQADEQAAAGTQEASTSVEGEGFPELPDDFDLKEPPEHWSEGEVYNFARYVQSQKDKVADQTRQLREKVEHYEELNPIAMHLANDPQLLGQVAQLMQQPSNGQPQSGGEAAPIASQASSTASPVSAQQQEPTQMPTPPEKPADYDPEDAVFNPDSASAKYEAKKDEYMEQLAQFAIQQTSQVAQLVQNQFQQNEQKTQRQQIVQKLMYEHDMSNEEANEFYEFANSEDSLNDADMWINAWKVKKGKQVDAPEANNPPPDNTQPNQTHEDRMNQKPISNSEQARRDQQRRMPSTAASQPSAQGAGQTDSDSLFNVQQKNDPVW